MKPITPEQFATCYGVFIADLVIVAKVIPAVNTWLQTTLPEVNSTYKLNTPVFGGYLATIDSFPYPPKDGGRYTPTKQADQYNNQVSKAWTAIRIDLKNALTCAEVNPDDVLKILASFDKLKPKNIKGFDGKY